VPFLTGNQATSQCQYTITLPRDSLTLAAYFGAMQVLHRAENFASYGTLTPDEMAQIFLGAFNSLGYECGGDYLLAIGTYTGDGNATQVITGVGFQPKMLIMWRQSLSQIFFLKSLSDGSYTGYVYDTGRGYYQDVIISLDSDGFTVGDNSFGVGGNVSNSAGQVYNYCALA